MATNMPPAEVEVSADLVAGLIAEQCPSLAELRVTPLSFGWDNFSFRVGADLVARLPRRQIAVGLVENEARWLISVPFKFPPYTRFCAGPRAPTSGLVPSMALS